MVIPLLLTSCALLSQLAGLLHHLPDPDKLRVMGRHGLSMALPSGAAEVYAAVPELVEFARQRDAELAALYAALRLAPGTPWPVVLAHAEALAERDPHRTLDGEVGDG